MKALFANCEGIIFQPLDDMFVPAPNGSIKNVTIETPNPLVEGEFFLTF
jgi:hypothetical protein